MVITTTLTGIAMVAATGAAIGTAAGIVIRPRVEYLAGAIKARFTKIGKDFMSAQSRSGPAAPQTSHRR